MKSPSCLKKSGEAGESGEKIMEPVILRKKELYNDFLILVNAEHPYDAEAEELTLIPVHPEAPDILLEEHVQHQLSALMEEINGWERIVPVSG